MTRVGLLQRLSEAPPRPWLVLLVAVLVTYGLGLGGDFVYDDLHSVRDNPALRDLGNLGGYFTDVSLFSSLDCRLYRPVLLCSFAVDAAISGMAPWMFKLSNLGLHFGACLLLMQLARGMGLRGWAALLGALFFAIHPLNSEAVLTVSGRSNLLMVFGMLAALRCHQRAMSGSPGWVLAGLGATAVSLGAKEPGMVIPVLMLILECLRLRQQGGAPGELRRIALRLLPACAMVVGYVVLRAEMLGAGAFVVSEWQGQGDVHNGHVRGLSTHLATMCLILPQALGMAVLPLGLSMDPAVPYIDDWSAPGVWGGLVLLLILVGSGLHAPRRRPLLFFATCLACGTAAPWVLKPLNLPFLEHRLYGPMAGLGLGLMAVIQDLRPATWRPRLWLPVAAYSVLLSGMALDRCLDFRSSRILWSAELEQNPDSLVAMAGMAVCHIEAREYREARPLLQRVVDAHPDRQDARLNLAEAHLQAGAEGDPSVALSQVEWLLRQRPDDPFFLLLKSRCLAALASRQGDPAGFDAAVAVALRCLEVAEPKGLVFRTAAAARRLQGDDQAALELLDRSLARGLHHYSVLLDRAAVLAALGRVSAARGDLLRAQRQAPFDPRILRRLQALGGAAAAPR